MRLTASVIVALVLACAPERPVAREPITDVAFLSSEDPVFFGASLRLRPDLRSQALERISSEVRGRLTGCRFYVVAWPIVNDGLRVPGFRGSETDHRPFIVVAWLQAAIDAPDEGVKAGDLVLPGLAWEVEHEVASRDDFGRRDEP